MGPQGVHHVPGFAGVLSAGCSVPAAFGQFNVKIAPMATAAARYKLETVTLSLQKPDFEMQWLK